MNSGPTESASKPPQTRPKCCLGMLYYSQYRHDLLKPPVCFGFGKGLNPAEEDAHTATDQVPGGDFKYLCFGYSAFDPEAMKRAATARTNATDPVQLPYCEGLEVVSAAAMSGKPELLTGGAGLPSTSSSPDPGMPGREEGVRERPGRAFTGRPGVPEGMDWDKFRERFDRMASRIADKMQSNATYMASSLKKSWQQIVKDMGGSDRHDR